MTHAYGPRFHLVDDAWGRSLLARLCHPGTHPPVVHQLLEGCYRHLFAAVAGKLLPTEPAELPTRMTAQHPEARLRVERLAPRAPVVVVDIARGGIVPSYLLQQALLQVLEPEAVRVDHLYYQRVTDAAGHVTGVQSSGSKIGGPVRDATLLLPDPMAATGGSIVRAVDTYLARDDGPPRRIVALHLIVTPEYLRRVLGHPAGIEVFALRVDRGRSAPEVLASVPGARWDEERGLDEHDYIVPGAGGLGEVLNNAWV
jgi:uracil phosphoribosyltransferase